MGQVFKLEEFGADVTGAGSTAGGSHVADASGADSAAYESGYRAGWDDAVTAEMESQARINAEFAHNIQDLGFTYHEARSHVLRALRPLLDDLLQKFLPEAISATTAPSIAEEIMSLAEVSADAPIDVLVAPQSAPAIRALMDGGSAVPLNLVEEPSMAAGQIMLRNGALEKEIDTQPALDQIRDALGALYDYNEKVSNG